MVSTLMDVHATVEAVSKAESIVRSFRAMQEYGLLEADDGSIVGDDGASATGSARAASATSSSVSPLQSDLLREELLVSIEEADRVLARLREGEVGDSDGVKKVEDKLLRKEAPGTASGKRLAAPLPTAVLAGPTIAEQMASEMSASSASASRRGSEGVDEDEAEADWKMAQLQEWSIFGRENDAPIDGEVDFGVGTLASPPLSPRRRAIETAMDQLGVGAIGPDGQRISPLPNQQELQIAAERALAAQQQQQQQHDGSGGDGESQSTLLQISRASDDESDSLSDAREELRDETGRTLVTHNQRGDAVHVGAA